jgi:hypothetical protein
MRTSPWFHLLLLIVLGVAFLLGSAVLRGQPTANAVRDVPSSLYIILPALAGIAVGTLRPGPRSTATGARIVVAITVLMLALDLTGSDAQSSVWRSLAALLRGGWTGAGELLHSYPLGHPRVVAEHALARGGLLLLPLVLVGLVMGVAAWSTERVTFRTATDGTVARWAVAWVLVPAAFALVLNWSESYAYRILFRGAPLWLPLVPYVPALIIALVGWRAAGRRSVPSATEGPPRGRDGQADPRSISPGGDAA